MEEFISPFEYFHKDFVSFVADVTEETLEASNVESLQRDLEESLNLSGEEKGDATVLEKSVTESGATGPDHSPDPQGQRSLLTAASAGSPQSVSPASASGQVASLASVSLKAVLQSQPQEQQITMTPAGDASVVLESHKVGGVPVSQSKPADADQGSGHQAIPANDSFSLDQPLDTSSARSVGSGSSRSRGSISDTMSSSPSPRKNPRRAHLAAKFFNPNQ